MTDSGAPLASAILGAGGYIGQHFARLLADHPRFAPPMLVGGDRSAGQSLEDLWSLSEAVPATLAGTRLRAATPAGLVRSGVRVAFSALPSGTAGPVERALARRGVAVFTNAADLRRSPGVPLLVPEVNPGHVSLLERRPAGTEPIVTNPNCSATGLALALAPIAGLTRPRRVHVATYQSLSGAGLPGVASLAIADNLIPYIAGEEEKIASETAWILGARSGGAVRAWGSTILAHCARVATREGHLEAVTVECSRTPSLAELRRAWSRFDPLRGRSLPTAPSPPIILRAESDRPQPIRDRWAGTPERARGMAVTIGRIRWTPPFLRFVVLVHNAVRGGAGGSVLNAEFTVAEGWWAA